MVCGVLGPKSNAHGPNEFLHIPYGKLTAAVAQPWPRCRPPDPPSARPAAGHARQARLGPRFSSGIPSMITTSDAYASVLEETQHWLNQAVIGLNLCPFAKAVQVRTRYATPSATPPTPRAC